MDFIDVHTHKKATLENVFSIENKYPNSEDFTTPFSIGIHPWYIHKDLLSTALLFIEQKLKHKNCYALGECGLDKLSKTDFELQKVVFRKQIELSETYQKPLIIHCVKAFQDIIEIKKECKPKQIWILHGFNKNKQVAESFLKNKCILSFGAAIINHEKLQEVLLEISLDKILLETDSSEFEIQEIYQKVAIIKNITVVKLQQIIKQNFKNIFKG